MRCQDVGQQKTVGGKHRTKYFDFCGFFQKRWIHRLSGVSESGVPIFVAREEFLGTRVKTRIIRRLRADPEFLVPRFIKPAFAPTERDSELGNKSQMPENPGWMIHAGDGLLRILIRSEVLGEVSAVIQKKLINRDFVDKHHVSPVGSVMPGVVPQTAAVGE